MTVERGIGSDITMVRNDSQLIGAGCDFKHFLTLGSKRRLITVGQIPNRALKITCIFGIHGYNLIVIAVKGIPESISSSIQVVEIFNNQQLDLVGDVVKRISVFAFYVGLDIAIGFQYFIPK